MPRTSLVPGDCAGDQRRRRESPKTPVPLRRISVADFLISFWSSGKRPKDPIVYMRTPQPPDASAKADAGIESEPPESSGVGDQENVQQDMDCVAPDPVVDDGCFALQPAQHGPKTGAGTPNARRVRVPLNGGFPASWRSKDVSGSTRRRSTMTAAGGRGTGARMSGVQQRRRTAGSKNSGTEGTKRAISHYRPTSAWDLDDSDESADDSPPPGPDGNDRKSRPMSKKTTRRNYTNDEDKAIISALLVGGHWRRIKEASTWKQIESEVQLIDRDWKSLRSRFKRKIQSNLDKYGLTAEEIDKLR